MREELDLLKKMGLTNSQALQVHRAGLDARALAVMAPYFNLTIREMGQEFQKIQAALAWKESQVRITPTRPLRNPERANRMSKKERRKAKQHVR